MNSNWIKCLTPNEFTLNVSESKQRMLNNIAQQSQVWTRLRGKTLQTSMIKHKILRKTSKVTMNSSVRVLIIVINGVDRRSGV